MGLSAKFVSDLPDWSCFAFLLVLGRCGIATALLPGLGETAAPAMVRVGLGTVVSFLLLPVVFPLLPAVPQSGLNAASMIAAEVATGLWFGWLVRLLCLSLGMAAQLIAYLFGVATVLQPDPELDVQGAALSTIFEVVAPLLLLTTGLYTLPLNSLAGSFRLIPPGTLLPGADGTAEVLAVVSQTYALALRLASPFLFTAVVWHVVIGLVARLVPRLQLYFISAPGQIVGGLFLLASVAGVILATWEDALRRGLLTLIGN